LEKALPVTHVVVFTTPTVVIVWKSICSFEVWLFESRNATKYRWIWYSAIVK